MQNGLNELFNTLLLFLNVTFSFINNLQMNAYSNMLNMTLVAS